MQLIKDRGKSAADVWDWYERNGKGVDIMLNPSPEIGESIETAKSELSTSRRTGLHYAAFFGRVEVVKRLMENKAGKLVHYQVCWY